MRTHLQRSRKWHARPPQEEVTQPHVVWKWTFFQCFRLNLMSAFMCPRCRASVTRPEGVCGAGGVDCWCECVVVGVGAVKYANPSVAVWPLWIISTLCLKNFSSQSAQTLRRLLVAGGQKPEAGLIDPAELTACPQTDWEKPLPGFLPLLFHCPHYFSS